MMHDARILAYHDVAYSYLLTVQILHAVAAQVEVAALRPRQLSSMWKRRLRAMADGVK